MEAAEIQAQISALLFYVLSGVVLGGNVRKWCDVRPTQKSLEKVAIAQ
ncbi:MAG: hypothetical protein AAGA75_05275 [Cyanobacteria bacterium P01_E01_bin.6]